MSVFVFLDFKMIPKFSCNRRKMRAIERAPFRGVGGPSQGTFMIGIIWAMRKS